MKRQVFIMFFLLLSSAFQAQVFGCTDPLSTNYNPFATDNDGSCQYASASLQATVSVKLPDTIKETSGLIVSNDTLYTHNDDNDINLYGVNAVTGTILKTLPVTGVTNKDWEELAQDSDYFYIGDFGNNVSGNRKNLSILKVSKSSLASGDANVESIEFSYSDQTDFFPKKNNSTDFDCEAMVVSQDSIYLFTKQWVSKKTGLYVLPKIPGKYTAQLKATFDIKGMITGATYLEDKKIVVVCGYNGFVTPFLYLLYDFKGNDFFSGNKRKIGIKGLGFHQVEGVATANGTTYYVSNESLAQKPFVNVVQKLHRFELSSFLSGYLENLDKKKVQNQVRNNVRIYPAQQRNIIFIDADISIGQVKYTFYNADGKQVLEGNINPGRNRIDIVSFIPGIYTVKLNKYPEYSYRIFKG